jgi:hypothetical protein
VSEDDDESDDIVDDKLEEVKREIEKDIRDDPVVQNTKKGRRKLVKTGNIGPYNEMFGPQGEGESERGGKVKTLEDE